MDTRAFELGYLMGRSISRVHAADVAAATRGLEAAFGRIVSVADTFAEALETLGQEGWRELGTWEEAPRRQLPWPRDWPERAVLEDLLRRAEGAYENAVEHARQIAEAMEAAGWHDAVQFLFEATPDGYGQERESVPTDVRRLADSLGRSAEEALDLIGGKLPPQAAVTIVREAGGSRSILARFLAMRNPFTTFLNRRVLLAWPGPSLERIRALWPSPEGWGPALGGAILVGADIVTVVEGVVQLSSLGSAAAAIQAAYSIPEGLARIQRGIAVMGEERQSRGRESQ